MGPAPRKADVTVVLPTVLAEVLGASRVRLRAATLKEALEEAYDRVPALRSHVCNDDGSFREHVLCFHNGTSTRELGTLDVTLREGDTISILQAVSGG